MTEAEEMALRLDQCWDFMGAALLRKLQAENETLRVDGDIIINRLAAENNRLHMELDAARADAGRYRWLREQPALDLKSDGSIWTNSKGKFVASHRLCAGRKAYSPYSTLDEIIDAAIKQGEPHAD